MSKSTDTIFALSSGALPAGVAVVRLSGDNAFAVVDALTGSLPEARRAMMRTIRTRNGSILDKGIVLLFPGPRSFTGEDCAELQIHGGKAVVAALLAELSSFDHCRLAENGEFSRRAFDNGRMDLLEAEGLADLLAAETEMQRRLAIEHSSGGLSQLYAGWASRLTHGRALIEAELDFSDEGDIPGSVSERVWDDLRQLCAALEMHLEGARFGEIVRDGLKVAIVGPPNSGKSSLLNALANRDVAIVTEIAGTTRDVLEVNLDIDGYSVRLYDTAGIRQTDDVVETEGIRRALLTMEGADVVLALEEVNAAATLPGEKANTIRVGTKSDLYGESADYDVCISMQSGFGLDRLRTMLAQELAQRAAGLTMAVPARRRHRLLLTETLQHMMAAVGDEMAGLDIRAEHLRAASQSLGRITGHVDVEDLLGVIFSEFCVGK
ncbi:tRNA uridine-5-carboxymethylaminomethyl(34) synthesis GTPase MnmE [Paraburkholderia sp.]|uniref:tRNA uridine-5-carboxymethylaminomethyl(34) synthesis GTPase MnmE n=1 Tax=Paraburkholderia sp. TaxID=1926495 RepID=UPI0023926134|nr:tRNA uridine-5-carboxymethylaminomethyl(34) synthesis GTPase MnmE [Paraburkholderia sp.]MDE1179306.1 tRNA uridine-5-carboxymethylaminomethyl(34) synthesis GTPase MnmE [Paraburkholderia sp.]